MLEPTARSHLNDTTIFNLGGTVYAFDSTTIELCLAVFCWAKFRKKISDRDDKGLNHDK